MSEVSITQWLDGLRQGNEAAAEGIWKSYYEKLVQIARRKLAASARRVSDEEDVALSALNSLCRGAAEGRFPRLRDRDDLWRLLFTITERKAIRQIQTERRLKRGGGQVSGESVFANADQTKNMNIGEAAVSADPTPQLASEIAENIHCLLEVLNDKTLRHIAVAKMEGFTNEEIATQLDCTSRSIKRRLRLIRILWLEGQSEG